MGKCQSLITLDLLLASLITFISLSSFVWMKSLFYILQVKYCLPYKKDEGFPNVKVLQVECRLLKEKDAAKNRKERNLEETVNSVMCLIL